MTNKNFTSWLSEAKGKGAVFTFGRFNPPTTGHEKLVNKLNGVAKGYGDALLFSSHSNDKVKNPLSHKDKVKYLKAFFGKKVTVIDTDVKQVFQILVFLFDKKYTKKTLLNNFEKILIAINPIIPHFSNECMNLLNLEKMNWPKYDESRLIENKVRIVIQINGKKRGLIETDRDNSEQDLTKIINTDKTLKKYLDNQTIKRKIFIKNKLMNIII